MAKEKVNPIGRVVVYGNPNYTYDKDTEEWTHAADYTDKPTMCDVFEIQDVIKDRIITSKYVLPLADATVSTSEEGLVYSYSCSLPYLIETAHLAEVEKNMIVGQAFLYPGRNLLQNKPSMMIWVLVGFLMIISLVGMFK